MKWRSDEWIAFLLILPALLYVIILAFVPAVASVIGSFSTLRTSYTLYNYDFVYTAFGYGPIVNTFIVTASALSLQFFIGFVVASLLSKQFRGRTIFSAIFLLPFGVATIVTAVIFHDIFPSYGGYANAMLLALGGHAINWTGSFWSALLITVLADSWKNAPIVSLILLAGMTTIPPDLYSQAMVDGAGTFQRFFRITLPNLAPFIAIALMIRGISEFNIFAIAQAGLFPFPLLTTMTYSLFDVVNPHPSYAGATILLSFVLIFALLIMLYRSKSSRWS